MTNETNIINSNGIIDLEALSVEECIHNLWKISVLGPVVLQPEISHAPIQRAHALILWVSGLYAGAFAHADDIRMLCTSRDTLEKQIDAVEEFATSNALSLNASKCEVVIVSSQKASSKPICTVVGQPLSSVESAKCLGYWWSWDLSADKLVDSAIE